MENNNPALIKGLAILLLAILGLNVYRTETIKKDIAQINQTVDQITARLDSLGLSSPSPNGASATTSVSQKQFSALSKKVSELEESLSYVRRLIDRPPKNPEQPGMTAKPSSSSPSSQSSRQETPITTNQPANTQVRVSVSAKVKVENRYVSGTTYLPKVTTGPTGTVVINVSMDRVGIVSSASVNSASTIFDEDIIDACKEAALKTSFGYNPEAPQKSTGTITYTFSPK